MKILRRVIASATSAALSVVVIAVPLTLVSAGSAGAESGGKAKAKVTVGDNFYKPLEVEVVAGTKVVWRNKGKILHNVVPDKGKAFGTKKLSTGSSYSYRFKKPGEYGYYCSFHGAPGSGQYGTIVVKAAPAPTTTTSSPPAG